MKLELGNEMKLELGNEMKLELGNEMKFVKICKRPEAVLFQIFTTS